MLLDWSRFAMLNKARQIGASHTYGAWAVLRAMLGELTVIVSVGLDDSCEVLEKCQSHAEVLAALGSKWAKSRANTKRIRFGTSGGRIIVNTQEKGARGYTGNVFLDELAYYKHPEDAWDGASAATMHGFSMRLASTPNGVGNFFHGLYTDPTQHHGFRLHQFTIDEARADGLKVSDDALWSMARGDERVYNQLFRCSFIDNDMQYLPTELVRSLVTDLEPPTSGGTVYGGIDIGKNVDLTVLTVVRLVNGIRWVTKVERRKRTQDEEIDALLTLAFNTYGCERVAIDATGLGAFPVQRNVKKWGLRRLIPVDFSLTSKEEMATGLYQMAVEKQLKIPRQLGQIVVLHPERQAILEKILLKPRMGSETAALCQDLLSLRRIVTQSGNITYDAPHTSEGHADSAWSLALALLVARSETARGVVNLQGGKRHVWVGGFIRIVR